MNIHPAPRVPALAVAVLASLLLAACGGSTASDPAPVISAFTATPATVALGDPSTLAWTVTGATSLSVDPGVGAVTGSSKAVTPAVTTTYTLTATGPGGTATRSATVTVNVPAAALDVACSGAGCGAASATAYAGTGIGIWKYRNTSASARQISIQITGVAAGKQALLLFSNGTALPAPTVPSAGTLVFPPAAAPAPTSLSLLPPTAEETRQAAHDAFHGDLLAANRELGLSLREAAAAERSAPSTAAAPVPAQPLPTPVVGDTRTWLEATANPVVSYDTTVAATCALPGGRNAVFWVDPRSTTNGTVTAADVDYFKTTFCGPAGAGSDGGFGRLHALLGDVWGGVPPGLGTLLISDTPTLQDVNVVFLEVQTSVNWAGYFYGCNNFRRGADARCGATNEALAFFIDSGQVKVSRSYIGSALLHELTHMVNFYQRAVSRNIPNDTWLEETTATMTDDMVTPLATPDHVTILPGQRILPYVRSGGAISLTSWQYPVQNSYALAGAFAGLVDRRYGTAILTGTIGCAGSGVDCVDGLIAASGGTSFEDDFGRAGASTLGLFPAVGVPAGYGYPQKTSGVYTIPAIDVSQYASSRKPIATSLLAGFEGGSHTYQLDTIPAGSTVYTRTGVAVPAGTSVLLVIQ